MDKVVLKRVSESEDVTMGMLLHEGVPFMCTMEKPWHFNKPFVSCIPKGIYEVVPNPIPDNPIFYNSFHVKNVPGRTEICIHIGNYAKDVVGCIAVGMGVSRLKGHPIVSQSKVAMEKLNKMFPKGFKLVVEGPQQ